jgi:hypothetical protein
MYVDRESRVRGRAPNFELKTFFGQLQHIFTVRLPHCRDLGLVTDTTVILAVIRNCKIEAVNDLDMHYYRDMGRLDVVDVTCLQCLVGRVKDNNRWAIIDRSGNLVRAVAERDSQDFLPR